MVTLKEYLNSDRIDYFPFGSKEKLKVIMNIFIYLIIIEQDINTVKNFLLVDMELV